MWKMGRRNLDVQKCENENNRDFDPGDTMESGA